MLGTATIPQTMVEGHKKEIGNLRPVWSFVDACWVKKAFFSFHHHHLVNFGGNKKLLECSDNEFKQANVVDSDFQMLLHVQKHVVA